MPKSAEYGSLEAEDMKRVPEAVRNGDISLHARLVKYSVPKATLERHVDGENYIALKILKNW